MCRISKLRHPAERIGICFSEFQVLSLLNLAFLPFCKRPSKKRRKFVKLAFLSVGKFGQHFKYNIVKVQYQQQIGSDLFL